MTKHKFFLIYIEEKMHMCMYVDIIFANHIYIRIPSLLRYFTH